jgi:hypothetical protein
MKMTSVISPSQETKQSQETEAEPEEKHWEAYSSSAPG